MTTHSARTDSSDENRANPMGAYITTVGALITLVAVWLPWVGLGDPGDEGALLSGYEADSMVPFVGFLALALSLALLYATTRADRRQHRGLSLASMAVGSAWLIFTIAFLLDPISTHQYPDDNVNADYGIWVSLIGALVWTVGSFLLAKEPEGDIERDAYARTETVARPAVTTERRAVEGETYGRTGAIDETRDARGATSTDEFGGSGRSS